jgi:hypothetical protein
MYQRFSFLFDAIFFPLFLVELCGVHKDGPKYFYDRPLGAIQFVVTKFLATGSQGALVRCNYPAGLKALNK